MCVRRNPELLRSSSCQYAEGRHVNKSCTFGDHLTWLANADSNPDNSSQQRAKIGLHHPGKWILHYNTTNITRMSYFVMQKKTGTVGFEPT